MNSKIYRDLAEAVRNIAMNEENEGKGIDHHVGNAFEEIKKVFQNEQRLTGGSLPSLTKKRKEYGGKSAAEHISSIANDHHDRHAAEVGHGNDKKKFNQLLDREMDKLF